MSQIKQIRIIKEKMSFYLIQKIQISLTFLLIHFQTSKFLMKQRIYLINVKVSNQLELIALN